MGLPPQRLREILAQYPQAEAIDPETGTVYYGSQLLGNYYVPGVNARARIGGGDPRSVPGAVHKSRTSQRWHLGLPSMGI